MTADMSSEPELEAVIFDALVENDGLYPHQLADKLAEVLRSAGFVWGGVR